MYFFCEKIKSNNVDFVQSFVVCIFSCDKSRVDVDNLLIVDVRRSVLRVNIKYLLLFSLVTRLLLYQLKCRFDVSGKL